MYNRLLNNADHIVTVSRWQKEVLLLNAVNENKVSFIQKGLSKELARAKR